MKILVTQEELDQLTNKCNQMDSSKQCKDRPCNTCIVSF